MMAIDVIVSCPRRSSGRSSALAALALSTTLAIGACSSGEKAAPVPTTAASEVKPASAPTPADAQAPAPTPATADVKVPPPTLVVRQAPRKPALAGKHDIARPAGSSPVTAIPDLPASEIAVVQADVEENGSAGEGNIPAQTIVPVDRTRIYSKADVDVEPPSLLYTQTSAPLFHGTHAAVNTMEILISDAGDVERVRLLSDPKRMTDMLLLAGAKNWRFQPARRNGKAVRYRLDFSWETTP